MEICPSPESLSEREIPPEKAMNEDISSRLSGLFESNVLGRVNSAWDFRAAASEFKIRNCDSNLGKKIILETLIQENVKFGGNIK